MGYLPSKNFIAIIGSAIVVVFAGYFASFVWKTGYVAEAVIQNTTKSDKNLAVDINADTNADTDGDGLKNWEEILWKTDTNKTDTDGDGMTDNDETKNGRDPTVTRSPLANGSWSDELQKPEKSDDPANGTVTGQFVEDFMKKYMGSKTAVGGAALPEKVITELVNSATANLQKNTASYKDEYAKKDINISKSADPKKYLNNLARALNENFKNISESELKVMESFSDTRDPAKLETLTNYILAYKTTVDFMKKEPVPNTYADLHLELLNSMQNTMLAAQNMQKMPLDPVLGLIGVNLYYAEVGRARQYLAALKAQTEMDKIAFADNEPGAFFNQYFDGI